MSLSGKAKKTKKKTHQCMTYGDVNVSCPKGMICCDPDLSNGGVCAFMPSHLLCLNTIVLQALANVAASDSQFLPSERRWML